MSTQLAPEATSRPAHIRFRTAVIDGVEVFYREAGRVGAPVVVLLHGFPSSSHMYRGLIPVLAETHHVIAPDYPGFGLSAAPPAAEFTYTFDHLADIIAGLLELLGLRRYALVMQDYGGPVGFRLASRAPDAVSALLVQNANIYTEGLSEALLACAPFWQQRTPETEAPLRALFAPEGVRFQYRHGTRDPSVLSPDAWRHDLAHLERPGADAIQLALLHDYQNNPPLYPAWQAYLREHRPPLLITWGRHDPFFTEAGARAYLRDQPGAELHFYETGHFALEEDGAEIGERMREFLQRHA